MTKSAVLGTEADRAATRSPFLILIRFFMSIRREVIADGVVDCLKQREIEGREE